MPRTLPRAVAPRGAPANRTWPCRAFSADPSDGGAEGAEADAPRADTASSDVSYGVNGNPVMASSSPSSTHEATAESSPAGASFGRRDPDPASPSSSFSQYEGSEQASRDDEEMATMTLPTRPFAVPNPYATPSHKQPNPIRAERRPTPEPTRPKLEQIRRSESKSELRRGGQNVLCKGLQLGPQRD
ncbi:hypothetical protein THAOC_27083 [Thalassiosira oceanica]|uniref:Uncharacterized protein n=1 Tax=Thalassiosira oceanica TaxID=159749 RepID=K0RID8_THAOC|nr:hypothetical protein THAOC_27083 [Thalassiosira oceanica]|eukprot:EJK53483.1 hypothetical protein THAOC_27083 [Thalassiosira oceanica]